MTKAAVRPLSAVGRAHIVQIKATCIIRSEEWEKGNRNEVSTQRRLASIAVANA